MRRYGDCLLIGYLMLFLVLHESIGEAAPGMLTQLPIGYSKVAEQISLARLASQVTGIPAAMTVRAACVTVMVLLSLVYLRAILAVRGCAQSPGGLGDLLLWAGLFCLPLMGLPYLLSMDAYSYIFSGREAVLYGGNPMVVSPLAYPQDPFLQYVSQSWRDQSSAYGPAWLNLTQALTLVSELGGGAAWLYLAIYKLAALALHLLSTVLIWNLLGRWRPRQQTWGTMLYAWNPLVLIELVGNAHNDVLMISLVLFALWLAQRGRWPGAAMVLVAATMVKWIAASLLLLYAILLFRQQPTWRSRLLRTVQVAGLVLVSTAILYAPYWQGPTSLKSVLSSPSMLWYKNSPGELAKRGGPYLIHWLGLGPDPTIATQVALALPTASPDAAVLVRQQAQLAAQNRLINRAIWGMGKVAAAFAGLIAVWAIWRRPTWDRFVESSFWVLMALLVFSTGWFMPWYVTWVVGLAALLNWHPSGQAAVLFSMVVMAIYLRPGQ